MIALASALAACQYEPREPARSASVKTPPALVQGVCGDCHAVEAPFLSPNPEAPSFSAIANREGLSEETLASWLIDAHNYPELMEFELTQEEAQKVTTYMLTLRDEDYEPEP
ncbi:MAG: hypothetical protein AAF707_01545 [Pseudomonadota bacterium]